MREDPIWREPIEVKQAVQDRFPPIGFAAARLRTYEEEEQKKLEKKL